MPKISEFAGKTLLHQGGNWEPQRKSNFALMIAGLSDVDTLILSLKSADPPPIAMTRKGIKSFNETMHYAGSVTPFAEMPLVYHDYIDRAVLPILSEWYNQVICFGTGAIGWAGDYKKQGTLYLLPPGLKASDCPGAVATNDFQGRSWTATGLWPMSLDYDLLDHDDDGGNALITMQLSVDRMYPNFMK